MAQAAFPLKRRRRYYLTAGLNELVFSGAIAMSKSLEERIAKIEQEIARLKGQSNGSRDKSNWISKISDSFKDDSEFDEILRLGR